MVYVCVDAISAPCTSWLKAVSEWNCCEGCCICTGLSRMCDYKRLCTDPFPTSMQPFVGGSMSPSKERPSLVLHIHVWVFGVGEGWVAVPWAMDIDETMRTVCQCKYVSI